MDHLRDGLLVHSLYAILSRVNVVNDCKLSLSKVSRRGNGPFPALTESPLPAGVKTTSSSKSLDSFPVRQMT